MHLGTADLQRNLGLGKFFTEPEKQDLSVFLGEQFESFSQKNLPVNRFVARILCPQHFVERGFVVSVR